VPCGQRGKFLNYKKSYFINRFYNRFQINTNTEKGKEFSLKRDQGEEIPLTDIINIIERELMSNRGGIKGFVIDG